MPRPTTESDASKGKRTLTDMQRPRREGRGDTSDPPKKYRRDDQTAPRHDKPHEQLQSKSLQLDSSAPLFKQSDPSLRLFSSRTHATSNFKPANTATLPTPLLPTPKSTHASVAQPTATPHGPSTSKDLPPPQGSTKEDSKKRSRQLSASSTSSVASVQQLECTPSPQQSSASPIPPPPPTPIPPPFHAQQSDSRKTNPGDFLTNHHGELDWSKNNALYVDDTQRLSINETVILKILPNFDILAFANDIRYHHATSRLHIDWENKMIKVSHARIQQVARTANNLLTSQVVIHNLRS